LALGDSYTIGQSVEESERWPVQLAQELNASGIQIDSVEIIAQTGWRTDQLFEAIRSKNITPPYELVSLLIGVNNQFQGQTAEEFRSEFVALLETAVELTGNDKDRVFVLSIPDWGVTPFGALFDPAETSLQIDQFNAVVQLETQKKDILFFDITAISRQALEDSTLIASDGLHPSGKMYRLWVENLLPTLSIINW